MSNQIFQVRQPSDCHDFLPTAWGAQTYRWLLIMLMLIMVMMTLLTPTHGVPVSQSWMEVQYRRQWKVHWDHQDRKFSQVSQPTVGYPRAPGSNIQIYVSWGTWLGKICWSVQPVTSSASGSLWGDGGEIPRAPVASSWTTTNKQLWKTLLWLPSHDIHADRM